tara:strand:+ start:617 stop:1573 length:957 start_codon:yes stop_codon:yes gene_type:complete
MALSTRQELIDYCLRRLGAPVIEVNVDDDQVSDRIDDALQHWNEYHFDGTERTYVKHKLTGSTLTLTGSATFTTGETITGGTSGAKATVHSSSSGTSVIYEKTSTAAPFEANETITGAESGTTATISSISKGDIENGFITVSNNILNIVRVFKFGAIVGSKSDGLFDVDYQFALNDLYNLLSADITYYAMTKTHMTTLEQMFRNERQIRWNRKTNKLHIDADLSETYDIDDYVVAEAYAILDPSTYTEVYDDMFLKRYATALIKRQWGENLKKFAGIQMPGGVTLNGDQIYQEAIAEIQQIEEEMQLKYELPPTLMVG